MKYYYKVVYDGNCDGDRKGIYYSAFLGQILFNTGDKNIEDIAKEYVLTYSINKTTEAPKDTLGIFVFNRLRDALNWVRGDFCRYNLEILKVKGHGEKKDLMEMPAGNAHEIYLYYHGLCCRTQAPPYGTTTFKSITPLSKYKGEVYGKRIGIRTT